LQVHPFVKATCRSMVDQPHRDGRGLVKKQKDATKEAKQIANLVEERIQMARDASRWLIF